MQLAVKNDELEASVLYVSNLIIYLSSIYLVSLEIHRPKGSTRGEL
jgi:hypothetical protein